MKYPLGCDYVMLLKFDDSCPHPYALDFLKNMELTWKQSVWSSSIASAIAAEHLGPGGLLVLSGAESALNGTPSKLAYPWLTVSLFPVFSHQFSTLRCLKSIQKQNNLSLF